jgi:hypothetical protein
MRKLILLVLGIVLSCAVTAQSNFTIKGSIKDTINFSATQYGSVSLIRAKDSILHTFTRAGEDGTFVLKARDTGRYILLVAHPSFAFYTDTVTVTKAETTLPDIMLISKKHLLEEVMISDARAITIKGDTTEYKADSFKTREYANVDELLKKLPGIEVKKDGSIVAYGETVKKMLVDGEEFFSDDPAMVAQTLRASTVDKVQVFDKKSDQAAFTGIDDGEKVKTINLQLKENAKRGYMGKISVGAGLPDYWENQAMIQAFKGKRKVSAFATMANTNNYSLGWNDMRNYSSSGGSSEVTDDGGVITTYDNSEYDGMGWGGQFRGEGLPKAWGLGGLYSNKWLEDKASFNGGYRYGKNIVEKIGNTRSQYILPDTQYVNQSSTSEANSNERHSVNTTTEYTIDTTSNLKLVLSGNYSKGVITSRTTGNSASMDGDLINDNTRSSISNTERKSINANLLYRKRFAKKGRTFSANFTGSWSSGEDNGLLYSVNNLYALGITNIIDQAKRGRNESLQLGARLSYTEPLSKIAFLEVNYSLNVNNRSSENKSFDRKVDGGEVEEVYNPLFSSDYAFNVLTNQGGANLRFNTKKLTFFFGGAVANAAFRQDDRVADTLFSYNNLNLFPKAGLTYRPNKQRSIGFNYDGRTNQPQLSQLQPLRTNTDPLNISIGNPDLKQEFRHNFSLNFNDYKVLSSRYIHASASFSFTQNAISQRQEVDAAGRRTYQYVNVNGNYNAYGYGGYSFGIKPLDLHTGIYMNANISRNNNFINGLQNATTTQSYGPSIRLSYDKDTTFDISVSFNPDYNLNTSSIRTDIRTKYWTFEQTLDAGLSLPLGFRIRTSIEWNIRQRLDASERNNNIFRWNAELNKSFLKDRSLVLKLSAYDILNQNAGYQRYSGSDMITENTYNNIRRYFMINLIWNFTKTAAVDGASAADTLLD